MNIEELVEKTKIGQRWRLYYGEGNLNNRLIHIRSNLVDGEYFVTRSYRQGRWYYALRDIYFFHETLTQGHLIEI